MRFAPAPQVNCRFSDIPCLLDRAACDDIYRRMKPRDHPLMRYRTMRNWPPVWIEKFSENKTLMGEIGVLKTLGVINMKRGTRCYLHITHNGKPYVGSLLFDDAAFCTQIANLLQGQIGTSIADIGDLDLSHTL